MLDIRERGSERPVALLVTAGGFAVGTRMQGRLDGGPAAVAAALDGVLAEAAHGAGAWPRTVRVRHEAVAEALRPLLEERDVEVAVVDPLPDLEEAARALVGHMTGDTFWPPVCRSMTWAGWGLSPSTVSDVFRAAANFWRAAPWQFANNLQAPRLTLPSGREWTAAVLGSAGEQFGLALYSDANDLFARSDGTPESPFEGTRGQIIALIFDRIADLPAPAKKDARLRRGDLAGRDAFPTLTTVNTPAGGVTEEDMADLILALASVPAFMAEHADTLEREEETTAPCRLIEWTHEPTGVQLAYDGEGARAELEFTDAEDDPVGDPRGMIRDAIAAAIEEVGENADESVIRAAITRRLAGMTESWNEAPQADLGGMSPAQVQRFMHRSDWIAGDGGMRIRTDLAPADLAGAPTFANARTLLTLAVERDGLPGTVSGNLKLVVVEEMLDRLRFDEGYVDDLRRVSKRITEQDVWPLHEPRVLLDIAGLMLRQGPRFVPTELGTSLVDDTRTGELYALLFRTCFAEFNLAYGRALEWPELQLQIAWTLYRLGVVARDWRPSDALVEQAVLPLARERAPSVGGLYPRALILESSVLDRLVGFGLLERKPRPSASPRSGPDSYRITRLYDAFFEFDV